MLLGAAIFSANQLGQFVKFEKINEILTGHIHGKTHLIGH